MPYDPLMRWEWEGGAVPIEGEPPGAPSSKWGVEGPDCCVPPAPDERDASGSVAARATCKPLETTHARLR